MSVERALAQKLRQTQADLAASQADLTAMEAERDQFRANYLRDAAALDHAREDLVRIEIERDDARAELASIKALGVVRQMERERDLARAELASARQELAQLRAPLQPTTPELQTADGEAP